jgi:hypothetical protein
MKIYKPFKYNKPVIKSINVISKIMPEMVQKIKLYVSIKIWKKRAASLAIYNNNKV